MIEVWLQKASETPSGISSNSDELARAKIVQTEVVVPAFLEEWGLKRA
jgi:hypothetical protein